jgi:hypothetical protein
MELLAVFKKSSRDANVCAFRPFSEIFLPLAGYNLYKMYLPTSPPGVTFPDGVAADGDDANAEYPGTSATSFLFDFLSYIFLEGDAAREAYAGILFHMMNIGVLSDATLLMRRSQVSSRDNLFVYMRPEMYTNGDNLVRIAELRKRLGLKLTSWYESTGNEWFVPVHRTSTVSNVHMSMRPFLKYIFGHSDMIKWGRLTSVEEGKFPRTYVSPLVGETAWVLVSKWLDANQKFCHLMKTEPAPKDLTVIQSAALDAIMRPLAFNDDGSQKFRVKRSFASFSTWLLEAQCATTGMGPFIKGQKEPGPGFGTFSCDLRREEVCTKFVLRLETTLLASSSAGPACNFIPVYAAHCVRVFGPHPTVLPFPALQARYVAACASLLAVEARDPPPKANYEMADVPEIPGLRELLAGMPPVPPADESGLLSFFDDDPLDFDAKVSRGTPPSAPSAAPASAGFGDAEHPGGLGVFDGRFSPFEGDDDMDDETGDWFGAQLAAPLSGHEFRTDPGSQTKLRVENLLLTGDDPSGYENLIDEDEYELLLAAWETVPQTKKARKE